MTHKFKVGDKVIKTSCGSYHPTISIEYVEKVYKNGNFILKDDHSRQQYTQPNAYATGEFKFGGRGQVELFTNELFETKFKPYRTKKKRKNIVNLLNSTLHIEEENLDKILELLK